jgi:hypothetical protein
MSATSAPFGLRPIGRLDNGSLEVFRQYPIASGFATNIVMGDVVALTDNGSTTTITKQTATGDGSVIDIVGIFVGCKFTDPNTKQLIFSQLWPASTVASDAMAYVVDDPQVLFAIQGNSAPSDVGDVYGKNAPLVQTAPNTELKISRVSVDITNISASTSDDPLRIIDYLGGNQGDEVGTAFPIFVCKFNYHQHTQTGS